MEHDLQGAPSNASRTSSGSFNRRMNWVGTRCMLVTRWRSISRSSLGGIEPVCIPGLAAQQREQREYELGGVVRRTAQQADHIGQDQQVRNDEAIMPAPTRRPSPPTAVAYTLRGSPWCPMRRTSAHRWTDRPAHRAVRGEQLVIATNPGGGARPIRLAGHQPGSARATRLRRRRASARRPPMPEPQSPPRRRRVRRPPSAS